MILLLDIGNSYLKLAHWQRGEIVEIGSYPHTVLLDDTDNPLLTLSAIERVIACNVSGPIIEKDLAEFCEKNGVVLEWVTSTNDIAGLRHCYRSPEELGNDRWVAMAGAHQYNAGNLLIVDCGTATTIDIVDANGAHRGGAILPGIATMRHALEAKTSDLRACEVDRAVQPFSRTTIDAIAGGTAYALAGAIDRFAVEAKKEFGDNLKILLCGGESETVMPLLQQKCSLDTKLVFKGLAVAAGLQ